MLHRKYMYVHVLRMCYVMNPVCACIAYILRYTTTYTCTCMCYDTVCILYVRLSHIYIAIWTLYVHVLRMCCNVHPVCVHQCIYVAMYTMYVHELLMGCDVHTRSTYIAFVLLCAFCITCIAYRLRHASYMYMCCKMLPVYTWTEWIYTLCEHLFHM